MTDHASRSPRRLRTTVAAAVLGVALVASWLPAPAAQAADPAPPRRIVTGWLPYWTSATSTASVVANADLMNEVSPFWYTAQWAGTSVVAEQVSASSKDSVLSQVRAAGLKVVPSVTDGMPSRQMAAVMANPSARTTFVNQLVGVAVANGYNGLDLDFEKFAFGDGSSTWATTRPAWVAFVAQLSAALHARGLMLAVTTPPIYNANRDKTSGYWVYDWAGIAPYVDRLRIMAYDYSVSVPGPIAPYPWVEKIVAFAVTQVPSGKIQIGVPSYGRDWVRRDASNKYLVTGTCPADNPPDYQRKDFTAAIIGSVLAGRGLTAANVTYDTTKQEATFRYSRVYSGKLADGVTPTSCTVFREAWYAEGRAAVARARLVGTYHLAGIAQWTLGGEDASQWSSLRSYARSIAPDPTTVTAVAPAWVGFRKPFYVTATARSAGLPVVDAPATLFFRKLGTKTWVKLGVTRTTTSGIAKFRTVLPWHGDFRVFVSGSYTRAAAAAQVRVRARTVVTATPVAASVRPGGTVVVSVATLPRISRQVVVRQVWSGGRWVTVAKAVVPRTGTIKFAVKPAGRNKTYKMRVVAAATSGWGSGTAYFTVHVR